MNSFFQAPVSDHLQAKPSSARMRSASSHTRDYVDRILARHSSSLAPGPPETVPVMDSLGRILRETLISPRPLPPYDKSVVDGYAVRQADVADCSLDDPVRLQVKGVIPAGCRETFRIGRLETYRIMTGAPIPIGADRVIKMEHVAAAGSRVVVSVSRFENDFICHAGEDLQCGCRVLEQGRPIHPVEMGILAACGRESVQVAARPRVGILSTGNELTVPGKRCRTGEVFDVNRSLLSGLISQAGALPVWLGVEADRSDGIEQVLNRHGDLDLVIITGGSAGGDFDKVRKLLSRRGICNFFEDYARETGCRIFLGQRSGRLLCSLPGNPAAAMINFLFFIRPVIDRMLGRKQVGLRYGRAVLMEDWQREQRRNELYRGRMARTHPHGCVRLLPWQKFGVLRPMLDMDVIVEIPRDTHAMRAGDRVNVHFLDPPK